MTQLPIAERHHNIRKFGIKIEWQCALGEYMILHNRKNIGYATDMLDAVEKSEALHTEFETIYNLIDVDYETGNVRSISTLRNQIYQHSRQSATSTSPAIKGVFCS